MLYTFTKIVPNGNYSSERLFIFTSYKYSFGNLKIISDNNRSFLALWIISSLVSQMSFYSKYKFLIFNKKESVNFLSASYAFNLQQFVLVKSF